MTELEIVAAEWVKAYERAKPSRHPAYWAGHYDGDRMLGSVHVPPKKRELDKTAFLFMVPFGYCDEITDSFFIRDAERTLEVTRFSMSGKAQRMTSWTLAYSINDYGRVTFPWPARKTPPCGVIVGVWEAVGLCRMLSGETYTFDDVMRGAIILAEAHL